MCGRVCPGLTHWIANILGVEIDERACKTTRPQTTRTFRIHALFLTTKKKGSKTHIWRKINHGQILCEANTKLSTQNVESALLYLGTGLSSSGMYRPCTRCTRCSCTACMCCQSLCNPCTQCFVWACTPKTGTRRCSCRKPCSLCECV